MPRPCTTCALIFQRISTSRGSYTNCKLCSGLQVQTLQWWRWIQEPRERSDFLVQLSCSRHLLFFCENMFKSCWDQSRQWAFVSGDGPITPFRRGCVSWPWVGISTMYLARRVDLSCDSCSVCCNLPSLELNCKPPIGRRRAVPRRLLQLENLSPLLWNSSYKWPVIGGFTMEFNAPQSPPGCALLVFALALWGARGSIKGSGACPLLQQAAKQLLPTTAIGSMDT